MILENIILSILVGIFIGMALIGIASNVLENRITYENYKIACQRIADDNIPIEWTPDKSYSACDVDFDKDGFEEGVVGINLLCYKFGPKWSNYCDNNIVLLN